MKPTVEELKELQANPVFQKLKVWIQSQSNSIDPSHPQEFVAHKALVETGRMEVFRIVDASIEEDATEKENNEKYKQIQKTQSEPFLEQE